VIHFDLQSFLAGLILGAGAVAILSVYFSTVDFRGDGHA
jgi:hypothetical protein